MLNVPKYKKFKTCNTNNSSLSLYYLIKIKNNMVDGQNAKILYKPYDNTYSDATKLKM